MPLYFQKNRNQYKALRLVATFIAVAGFTLSFGLVFFNLGSFFPSHQIQIWAGLRTWLNTPELVVISALSLLGFSRFAYVSLFVQFVLALILCWQAKGAAPTLLFVSSSAAAFILARYLPWTPVDSTSLSYWLRRFTEIFVCLATIVILLIAISEVGVISKYFGVISGESVGRGLSFMILILLIGVWVLSSTGILRPRWLIFAAAPSVFVISMFLGLQTGWMWFLMIAFICTALSLELRLLRRSASA